MRPAQQRRPPQRQAQPATGAAAATGAACSLRSFSTSSLSFASFAAGSALRLLDLVETVAGLVELAGTPILAFCSTLAFSARNRHRAGRRGFEARHCGRRRLRCCRQLSEACGDQRATERARNRCHRDHRRHGGDAALARPPARLRALAPAAPCAIAGRHDHDIAGNAAPRLGGFAWPRPLAPRPSLRPWALRASARPWPRPWARPPGRGHFLIGRDGGRLGLGRGLGHPVSALEPAQAALCSLTANSPE